MFIVQFVPLFTGAEIQMSPSRATTPFCVSGFSHGGPAMARDDIRFLYAPGIGTNSVISIDALAPIMKCGCPFIDAASASFDSACMTE